MNDLQDLDELGQGRKGAITRGKTAPNRLRSADLYLALAHRLLVSAKGRSFFCDLGFGEDVFTLAQSAAILRRINPGLPVLGVEIDPDRVERACAAGLMDIEARLGGFELPLKAGESVRIVRAFNVLRQYKAFYYREALELMAPALVTGGIIFEGSSSPWGDIWCANVFKKNSQGLLDYDSLVFRFAFKEAFSPSLFPPLLPRNLIEKMVSGEAVYCFFKVWEEVFERSRQLGVRSNQGLWKSTARMLAEQGFGITLQKRFLSRGLLILNVKGLFQWP
ncbi:MAG: hypothetical protein JXR70_07780 [Spirochaetales bacterium]|nr:hypothetical protein [Spirochaetales bacterium]